MQIQLLPKKNYMQISGSISIKQQKLYKNEGFNLNKGKKTPHKQAIYNV